MLSGSRDVITSVADHCRVGDIDAQGGKAEQCFTDDFRLGRPSFNVRCPHMVMKLLSIPKRRASRSA